MAPIKIFAESNNSKIFNRSGFTIIEIIIFLLIITIVFGIIITSSNIIQKNARNAKRQSDLRLLQSALQQYYADKQFYPDGSFNITDSATRELTDLSGNGNPEATTPKNVYLRQLPSESTPSQLPYVYVPYKGVPKLESDLGGDCDNTTINKCQFYILCVKLENNLDPVTQCPQGYNFKVDPISF
ncbi:hypothetical protein HYS97_01145 [Candidatus Daviesbacteria bacterium]|nr:hypothetical protein [Candidatus Daviesbacteria bacterium]